MGRTSRANDTAVADGVVVSRARPPHVSLPDVDPSSDEHAAIAPATTTAPQTVHHDLMTLMLTILLSGRLGRAVGVPNVELVSVAAALPAGQSPRHGHGVPVRTKRWNDPVAVEDGYRLLICRYRPRGVLKEATADREGEPWDAWCNALAPSVELHAAAYGKTGEEPLPWPEYARRFLEEMKRQRFWIESFAARIRAGETITLLCSSACVDESRCHRTLVRQLLEEAAFPDRSQPPSGAGARSTEGRVIRRRATS
jgi:uncharacterized protein YeaO (DUF488 family)